MTLETVRLFVVICAGLMVVAAIAHYGLKVWEYRTLNDIRDRLERLEAAQRQPKG